MRSLTSRLCLLVAQDVGVTGIEDGHGGAAVQLTQSSAQVNLIEETSKPMNPPKSDETSSLGNPQALFLLSHVEESKWCAQHVSRSERGHGKDVLTLLPEKWWMGALDNMLKYSSSDLRRGGVLPAMMMSLALPERRLLRVDL